MQLELTTRFDNEGEAYIVAEMVDTRVYPYKRMAFAQGNTKEEVLAKVRENLSEILDGIDEDI